MTILFLAVRMQQGFGVAIVIDNLCRQLNRVGVATKVGCIEHDQYFAHLDIEKIEPDAEAIAAVAQQMQAPVIIAHTTPYFEVLTQLSEQFRCWAWEHGDPNPMFFFDDRVAREQIIQYKKQAVYGQLEGVIAISEFIKSEIEVPQAHVIYNGCDHVPDPGNKTRLMAKPFKIGTLMRLGAGEALYKGSQAIIQLQRTLQTLNIDIEFHVMGRGETHDGAFFTEQGFSVHLNASDQERAEYLQNLDVFISTSLWEGCNLPLLEAQASGTVGIAFDTGAHPEMTPLIARNLQDMVVLIQQYCANPELLMQHSHLCHDFARKRFNWQQAAAATIELLEQ